MIDPVFNAKLSRHRRQWHAIFLLLRIIFVPIWRVLFRFKVYGIKNIPSRGGALIVGNHVHNLDPIAMLSGCPRPIHWMAKADIWEVPVLKWFAVQSGGFPVERGSADRRAVRTAVQKIQDGLFVGMFPEGTRSTTGGLKEPFAGASLVATRSGAPVIPCVTLGSDVMPFNGIKQVERQQYYPRVRVVFGKPFHLDTHDSNGRKYSMVELTDAMMGEIASMLPPHMRGIYADVSSAPHPAIRYAPLCFPEPE